jgi:hypothetical protein
MCVGAVIPKIPTGSKKTSLTNTCNNFENSQNLRSLARGGFIIGLLGIL